MIAEDSTQLTCSSPFLGFGDRPAHHEYHDETLKRNCGKIQWTKLYLLAAYIPAITLTLWSYFRYSATQCSTPSTSCLSNVEIPSPVLKSTPISLDMRQFSQDFLASGYAGNPTPELDSVWHSLLEGSNIRLEKQDLDVLGLHSIPIASGGYIAQLGVFHELHCLKKIRHWVYKDYYVLPKNLTDTELDEWPAHIDHCIEMLRQYVMCQGDLSIMTFRWIGDKDSRFPTIWDRSPHQCINWDTLKAWTMERSINISVPGALIDEEGKLYP